MANRIQLQYFDSANVWHSLHVYVSDNSTRTRGIMDENKLTLDFSLPVYAEISSALCEWQGTTYHNYAPPQVRKNHDRSYTYTLEMFSEEHLMHTTKMRDIVLSYDEQGSYTGGNRLSFPLTGTPLEHLRMVIASLNYKLGYTRGTSSNPWKVGTCIDTLYNSSGVLEDNGTEKCIAYDYTTLHEALNLIAEAYDTEWEINAQTRKISLHKVSFGSSSPLPLSYGADGGLKSGVARSNAGDVIDLLYVQGTEQNIDPTKYGVFGEILNTGDEYVAGAVYGTKSQTLLLPAGGRIWYNGRTFVPYRPDCDMLYQSNGRICHYNETTGEVENSDYSADVPVIPSVDGYTLYEVTPDRLAVRKANRTTVFSGHEREDVYDGTDIYPKRVGTVTSIETLGHEEIATYGELPSAGFETVNKIYHVADIDSWYICLLNDDDEYVFEELSKSNAPLVDFYDSMEDCPDYSECSIKGEVMTVIFQSGMLAGKEFDLNTTEAGTVINPYIEGQGRKFEIVPQEIDGQVMPSPVGGYMPKAGDEYAIFHCRMPYEYIRKDIGASYHRAHAEFEDTVATVFEGDEVNFTLVGPYPHMQSEAVPGEPITVYFRTGALAGYSFLVRWSGHDRLYMTPRTVNGRTMPSQAYMPQAGDRVIVRYSMFQWEREDKWILQGAEWDLMRAAVKHLHEYSEATYSVSVTIDPVWLADNRDNRLTAGDGETRYTVKEYLVPGGHVTIDDSHVPAGKVFRIMSVQEKLNNPNDVAITLSDSLQRTGVMTRRNRERGERLKPTSAVDTAIIAHRDTVIPS